MQYDELETSNVNKVEKDGWICLPFPICPSEINPFLRKKKKEPEKENHFPSTISNIEFFYI